MKKRLLSTLLTLCIVLALMPGTVWAAQTEEALPDWYFLFTIFKNVDADGKDGDGKALHTKYSMSQEEVDIVRDYAREFKVYMNQVGVMRAHVDVVEIDTTVTELGESSYGSWISEKQAVAFYSTGLKDVYYSGTEAQWKAIQIGEHNDALTNANIHCNSTGPSTQVPVVMLSQQNLTVDGETVECEKYSIGGGSFFQLQELGNILGFEVGYDAASNTATVRNTRRSFLRWFFYAEKSSEKNFPGKEELREFFRISKGNKNP